MWLTSLFEPEASTAGAVAPVSYAEGSQFGAVSEAEYRGLPVFGPGGSSYIPKEGERLLILRCDGGDLCAGVAGDPTGLLPGELRLGRPDGGNIHIRQDGSVVINGLVITADGQIHSPQG